VLTVTTVQVTAGPAGRPGPNEAGPDNAGPDNAGPDNAELDNAGHENIGLDNTGGFRQRLLDALAACIADAGYRKTTVADIVRRARTSRRTFYEHFSDKEACYLALLAQANAELIREISAAVDPQYPWEAQVRLAVEAWIARAESQPAITLSWIRDVPLLGAAARGVQRNIMDSFVTMMQTLCDTGELRAAGIGPIPRQLAIILIGGLRELIATTVEDGGHISGITEIAVRSSIALLGHTGDAGRHADQHSGVGPPERRL
jgi:AcrR family transcriptional regulator